MSVPVVSEFTRRWFAGLPELYRAADEAQDYQGDDNGQPLLRYMSLIGDQAGEIETLVDRIALHESTDGVWWSDLANPDTADDAWLTWIAQLAGIQVALGSILAESYAQLIFDYTSYNDVRLGNLTYAQLRHHGSDVGAGTGPDQIRQILRDAALGRLMTSTGDWERILAPYLTGHKRVIHDRIYGGDPWHLHLETYSIETPSAAVITAVIERTPWAAGLVVSYHVRSGSSYGEVATGFATYGDLAAALPSYLALSHWIP